MGAAAGPRGDLLPLRALLAGESRLAGVSAAEADARPRRLRSGRSLQRLRLRQALEQPPAADARRGAGVQRERDERRRGGLVKLHISAANKPQTDLKVYDYLWVGEGGNNGDKLREIVKNHPPYVAPCLDMSRAKIAHEDELYLHAIPYMQFPVLLAGRPFTGERAQAAGVNYPRGEACFWTRHLRAMGKHYREHPEGPHSYGWWDSCPGRPEARPTHARWLKQYLPLVEEGTWAWLEISNSDLFAQPPPKDVVASAFANREFHLVLANYGQSAVEVATRDAYAPIADPTSAPRKQWQLPARSLHILRKS